MSGKEVKHTLDIFFKEQQHSPITFTIQSFRSFHKYPLKLFGPGRDQSRRVRSDLLRQVAERPSLAGMSRFFSQVPWQAWREIQRCRRRQVPDWLHEQFQSSVEPDSLYDLFAACDGSTKKCKQRESKNGKGSLECLFM